MHRSRCHWSADEIAYCANVHPGTTASAIENNLKRITSGVRQAVGLKSMYVGLWFCDAVVKEYQQPENLFRLRAVLDEENLKVVTLNGFPQGNFHQKVVKRDVYSPSWSSKARLHYTISLAHILAKCLPDDVSVGSISSLPLAYRLGWHSDDEVSACDNLFKYAIAAQAIENETGKQIRLCLEMEPGCVLERTSQVIQFFSETLPEFANRHDYAPELIERYLGICFDICHQAVMQENIANSVREINNAGVIIGKVQVSSAMKVNVCNRDKTFAALRTFAEPKYMHQVTTRCKSGQKNFFDDLIDMLDSDALEQDSELLVHYHLPIQSTEIVVEGNLIPGFSTTRDAIELFFDSIKDLDYTPHIEMETYTWQVLPGFKHEQMPEALIQGLTRERAWLFQQLQQRDLIK